MPLQISLIELCVSASPSVRLLSCSYLYQLYLGLSRWCNMNLQVMTISTVLIWWFGLVEKLFNSQLPVQLFGSEQLHLCYILPLLVYLNAWSSVRKEAHLFSVDKEDKYFKDQISALLWCGFSKHSGVLSASALSTGRKCLFYGNILRCRALSFTSLHKRYRKKKDLD